MKHYLAFTNKTACGIVNPRTRYVTVDRTEVTCKRCLKALTVSAF